jgi:hypoxanthine phosphoribosyltransferase
VPVSTDNDLWISWDEYHRAIEALAVRVHESGWTFDQVLCLARGGLRPGDVFSRVFDVPLAILSASSYREEAGTVQGELDIAKHITSAKGTLAGKILLVDDLVDSGVTLAKIQDHLRLQFPAVTELKTAVIWYKACSAVRPDFYLDYLETNPWIHQPFEEYDNLRVHQLAKRLKQSENGEDSA